MKRIQLIALAYVLVAVSFIWGAMSIKYKVFPGPGLISILDEWDSFTKGHPDEPQTSPLKKLVSDMGGVPFRYVQEKENTLTTPANAQEFSIDQSGILFKGYSTPNKTPPGYILFFSAFQFPGKNNVGAVLISTDGKLEGVWPFANKRLSVIPDIDFDRKVILPSGKYHFPWGCNISDIDRELDIKSFANGHHGIQVAPDGTYWIHVKNTDIDNEFVQLDPTQLNNEGHYKVIKRISLNAKEKNGLPKNNQGISPLSTRLKVTYDYKDDQQRMNPVFKYLDDPFHDNDLEPIVHPKFPSEWGYALLASVRSENLIMVFDPATSIILWYRQGLTERQHDPDQYEDGVYVFNNGTIRGYSSLDYIPYDSKDQNHFGAKTIIDGRQYDWYDPSRGQHSVLTSGGERFHLIVNDRNGRLMIFNAKSELLFEGINFLPDSDLSARLQIWSALFLTQEQVDQLNSDC